MVPSMFKDKSSFHKDILDIQYPQPNTVIDSDIFTKESQMKWLCIV